MLVNEMLDKVYLLDIIKSDKDFIRDLLNGQTGSKVKFSYGWDEISMYRVLNDLQTLEDFIHDIMG